jgi:DNA repair protein RecO
MSISVCEALVLDARPSRDHDLWVRFLSPELGIVSCTAWSAVRSRQRFPSGVDHLTRIQAELRRTGDRYTLKSVTVLDPYWVVKSDFDRTCVGSLLCELLVKAHFEEHEWKDTYDFALDVLETLNDRDFQVEALEALVYAFQGVLTGLGFFHPNPRCPQCRESSALAGGALSFEEGALLCSAHAEGAHAAPLAPPVWALMSAVASSATLRGFVARLETTPAWDSGHARAWVGVLARLAHPAFGELKSLKYL